MGVCSDSYCPRKPQKQTEPLSTMALFGYARVSMREPEAKNLDLVVEGDALVVTHIGRLPKRLIYGVQVMEDLNLRGVEFRSLTEDFATATAKGKSQLTTVLAFSEWWRNSIRKRSRAGQHKAREEGRFPGRTTVLTERQKEYVRGELARLLEVSR